jgi:hypothetical protein
MPYIKTAFFNEKKSDDIQSHVNPVRVRVSGVGNLQAVLNDTGAVNNAELFEQAMSLTTARSVNYLSNFTAEKICLTLMTNEINEQFSISNIWAYVKPSRMSFPQ